MKNAFSATIVPFTEIHRILPGLKGTPRLQLFLDGENGYKAVIWPKAGQQKIGGMLEGVIDVPHVEVLGLLVLPNGTTFARIGNFGNVEDAIAVDMVKPTLTAVSGEATLEAINYTFIVPDDDRKLKKSYVGVLPNGDYVPDLASHFNVGVITAISAHDNRITVANTSLDGTTYIKVFNGNLELEDMIEVTDRILDVAIRNGTDGGYKLAAIVSTIDGTKLLTTTDNTGPNWVDTGVVDPRQVRFNADGTQMIVTNANGLTFQTSFDDTTVQTELAKLPEGAIAETSLLTAHQQTAFIGTDGSVLIARHETQPTV